MSSRERARHRKVDPLVSARAKLGAARAKIRSLKERLADSEEDAAMARAKAAASDARFARAQRDKFEHFLLTVANAEDGKEQTH